MLPTVTNESRDLRLYSHEILQHQLPKIRIHTYSVMASFSYLKVCVATMTDYHLAKYLHIDASQYKKNERIPTFYDSEAYHLMLRLQLLPYCSHINYVLYHAQSSCHSHGDKSFYNQQDCFSWLLLYQSIFYDV